MRGPYSITFNQYRNTVTLPSIEFVTNDYMTCSLVFKIMKNDLEASDLTGKKVYLVVKTPSGKSIQERCIVNDAKAGISNILLPQDLILEQGLHQAELQVVDAENNIVRMTSPRFSYNVKLSLQNNDTEEAKNKLTQLQEALEMVGNIEESHQDMRQEITNTKSQLNDVATDVSKLKFETTSKTIYVSVNTGNDTTGDGSVSLPYKTINKAISTVNKNIATQIKIRVLAGNYISQGAISLKNFSGTSLTLTAFDGTSDVLLPSDNYSLDFINCYDCDSLFIQGFKCSPSQPGYGIFISNCRFVNVVGYKNTTVSRSGLGVTGNSFVWVKDSTAQNLDTVISSNQGGTVVSQNWINSTGNGTGLVVNTGAKIHKFDDAQPIASNAYSQSNGGVIFDKNGNTNSFTDILTPLNGWNVALYTEARVSKVGNVCTLNATLEGGAIDSYTKILTLPSKYVSSNMLTLIAHSAKSGVIKENIIRILSDGKVDFINPLTVGETLYIAVSYSV